MMYSEDQFLMLSGIQHFIFCRRQWALIHIEQQWEENLRTTEGNIMHERAHDVSLHEKRGDVTTSRALKVHSSSLGISGECDVVEFIKNDSGVQVNGLEGKYDIIPIEYKKGRPKTNVCDELQLVAQAMCLEEMLCCCIPVGYLYYGEIKHRVKVEITDELRHQVEKCTEEMHNLYSRRYTPKVKQTKACKECSLVNICLPELDKIKKASTYVRNMIFEEN